ncbi:transglutaminase domain-containing protein [Flavobacterium sedimenticola]|uniref:Transglutaminase domain-containing protein n=1 Tax=Flavobacterium sedimenticola TaxID=3043286 RepID=A0ABT6XPJ6_9FLAO|nr:transglutaminase domain-containing protein [Flavobacterium sedimenticola]MDI9257019.1 transglutaminase domain-containing protein [Flavobacterium sedimenticola]
MKKNLFLLLLFPALLLAQTSEKKVWDLLLANKRADAKKLYDKEFKTTSESKLEYFLLGKIIELENGRMDFDETFVTTMAKFPESKYYLTSLMKQQFILDDIQSVGFNDYTYQKIDNMAASEVFKNDPMVIYYKAIADRNRKNMKGYNEYIAKLNSIMNWQLCGAFENLNDSGIDIEYEPEVYPKNDRLFDANSNGKIGWYNPSITQNEGYHTFSNEDEYGNGIMYSQIFVENPTEQEVLLNFGMSASLKIFVNDVEVYVNTLNKMSDLNAFKLKLKLPKGLNRILVKSSISRGNNYFFLSVTDTQNQKINGLVYHNTYKEYVKSTLQSLQVEELNPDYENYLVQKVKENPTNVLYKFMLYDAYMHNKKLELAHDVIEELDNAYPNSSIVKTRLASYYSYKDDDAKVNEIVKNLEQQDPDYYYTIATKAQDRDWMKTVNIAELEKMREKAKKLTSPLYGLLYDFLINARNSNIESMMKSAESILALSHNSEFYTTTFAPLYDSLEKDKDKAIKMLEDLVSKKDNFTAMAQLVRYYEDANRKDDVKRLFLERKKNYPYFTGVASDYMNMLIEEKKYTEALAEIDQLLTLFPYSFYLMERKGMVYNYMGNVKEAEKYIRQSLEHNSENSKLRKQLYDITKTPDEIEEIDVKDKYKLIKERRNSKLKSDYGVVTLLDEYIVNILPEGGRKSKVVLIYEITAENGIEEMKEYNLNTYSNTLQKSEVVKTDGTLVPAEEGGGTLVFSDLKVGDVIYIEYESYSNSTGRFYRDFNLDCYFNSTYPSVESIFAIINPETIKYTTKLNNGNITPIVKKINGKVCTIWKRNNVPAMPLLEPYSFNFTDLTNTINVSSIKSWKDISNWYADLVKKTLILDKITKSTFDQIFPKGVTGMTQEAIAKKIYAYIEENIKYSSQDFRQSGYVPQKPSKTITTKLGDCKDVSALFVALSQLAGLKSNLVLVSTNDNSAHLMSLPSKDFNHCIVKTTIDGKETFLELTDKFLPFKALPMSLYKAKALVISFDKAENEKAEIIDIPFDNAVSNSLTSSSVVNLTDNEVYYVNTHIVKGANKSYYNELFSNSTTEDVRKKDLEEQFSSKIRKGIKLQSVKVIKNEFFDEAIEFETQLKVSEKAKSVGNLKIAEIPFVERVYTRDIVAPETRNYDINYIAYENNLDYNSTIYLNVPEGKKFTEVPESKTFAYKNHKYSISFELVKPNSLKIVRVVKTPWDTVTTADYPEYKKYLEEVLTTEEQVVGFK